MRVNQGNILRVVHETNCTREVAIEALEKNNNWIDTFRYAKGNNN